jgi:hypothetical protein
MKKGKQYEINKGGKVAEVARASVFIDDSYLYREALSALNMLKLTPRMTFAEQSEATERLPVESVEEKALARRRDLRLRRIEAALYSHFHEITASAQYTVQESSSRAMAKPTDLKVSPSDSRSRRRRTHVVEQAGVDETGNALQGGESVDKIDGFVMGTRSGGAETVDGPANTPEAGDSLSDRFVEGDGEASVESLPTPAPLRFAMSRARALETGAASRRSVERFLSNITNVRGMFPSVHMEGERMTQNIHKVLGRTGVGKTAHPSDALQGECDAPATARKSLGATSSDHSVASTTPPKKVFTLQSPKQQSTDASSANSEKEPDAGGADGRPPRGPKKYYVLHPDERPSPGEKAPSSPADDTET